MRVLVACEESQEVCKAFRALGHEAYSCDIGASGRTEKQAIKFWNTRSPILSAEELERLEATDEKF